MFNKKKYGGGSCACASLILIDFLITLFLLIFGHFGPSRDIFLMCTGPVFLPFGRSLGRFGAHKTPPRAHKTPPRHLQDTSKVPRAHKTPPRHLRGPKMLPKWSPNPPKMLPKCSQEASKSLKFGALEPFSQKSFK